MQELLNAMADESNSSKNLESNVNIVNVNVQSQKPLKIKEEPKSPKERKANG